MELREDTEVDEGAGLEGRPPIDLLAPVAQACATTATFGPAQLGPGLGSVSRQEVQGLVAKALGVRIREGVGGAQPQESLTTDADGVVLDEETLDAIDGVVAPGDNVDPRNSGWFPPSLAKEHRRTARG